MNTSNTLIKKNSAQVYLHHKFYILFLFIIMSTTIFGQNITINGKIVDTEGESMIGVNIIIKGTTTGTVTDFDGNYTLNAQLNDTLLLSYIGFLNKVVPVNGRTQIDITLTADLKGLDEVVVVGYGIQKKSDVTGSVASIKSEDIEQMKANNITEALQGRAAGVAVTTNSGAPGADMMVTVRGIGTINNYGPLWVIDGVPSGGGYVNPSDIESMEILKDASACAIYGSRGANGVIIITTKKGIKGKGIVSYDGSYRLGSLPKKLTLTNAKDWAMLRNEAYINAGQIPPDEISNWPLLGEGTDWQEEITRQAVTHENNLSFSGGSEKLSYFLSLNHLNQEGIVQKSNYKRTTLRLNTSYKIKEWLTVGENISISNEITNTVNEDDEWNAVMIQAIAIDPITKVRNDDGSWDGSDYNTMNNPVAHLDRTHNEGDDYNVGGNVYLNFDLFEGLTFRTDLGIDNFSATAWDFNPTYFVKTGEENAVSSLSQGHYKSTSISWSNYATYLKDINLHSFSVMLGSEAISRHEEWFGTRAIELPSNDLRLVTLDNASGNTAARSYGSYKDYRVFSLFGRVNYSYNNKYLLTVNGRRDGSSMFGPEKRYAPFMAFSTGWKLSEEQFMDEIYFINSLKIRVGWGSIGNDNIQPYEFVSSATAGKRYVFGNNITNGTAFMKLANPELAWEETKTTNIGIDIAFLENQFTTNIDIYSKRTDGMLVDPPVQAHIGAEIPTYQNIGEMINKGIEIELGYKKTMRELKISVSTTFAYNKNEVVNLGNTDYILSGEFMGLGQISRTEVGHPVASFYGFLTDGLFQNQAEIDAHTGPDGSLLQPSAAPGDIRYKDRDGDGNLDQDFIGSPLPDFTYGLNTHLEYKNFDFTLFLQGVQGNEVFNATRYYTQNSSIRYNVDESMIDRWMFEGSTNDVNTPRLNLADANNSKRSDRYVEDGSYLRVKSIQLGYNFNTNLFNNKIERLRIYVGANNIYTFTKYSGFDPEVGMGYDGSLDLGIDRAKYPSPRTFLAGLNLTF